MTFEAHVDSINKTSNGTSIYQNHKKDEIYAETRVSILQAFALNAINMWSNMLSSINFQFSKLKKDRAQ